MWPGEAAAPLVPAHRGPCSRYVASVDGSETPLEHRAHHLAGAIDGTILATTVVATIGTHPETLDRSVQIVVGTSVVFWLAHVYSLGLAARVVVGRPLRRSELVAVAVAEWPMLQSSWPIVLALMLGAAGVLEPSTSTSVAMALGIGAHFTYGLIIGRQESLGWQRTLLNAMISGAFGLAILTLKLAVH